MVEHDLGVSVENTYLIKKLTQIILTENKTK